MVHFIQLNMNEEQIINNACNFLKALFHEIPEMLENIEEARKNKSISLLKVYMAGVSLTAAKMADDLDLLAREKTKNNTKDEC